MIILIKLLLAHFIGDFLLQPTSWVKDKEANKSKSIYLYAHILIHGLLIILVLWNINHWRLALLLMGAHGIIDAIKLYAQKEENKSNWFIIDQIAHIISIIVMWVLFFKPEINLNPILSSPKIWIYTTATLLITVVSGIVMRELMSTWSASLDEKNDESLSNAGKYIGMLERLFVFIFVITGNWEGIGFLLAAKSVFRFGDLKESKDRKLTEYILIGTLLSFGIAIAVGMLVIKLIGYV
ncbi:MAG: DUF3307 domain-containing protein [Flavobacteriales bacterium]|nr:DUF3307 domain-containing protein [Flavobacteriales bacterium]